MTATCLKETTGLGSAVDFRQPLYRRLKPGPGQSSNRVEANQRARLCGAMIELVTERGFDGVRVRDLSRLAAVSTKTFYACYASVEECFLATHARIVGDALRSIPAGSAADEDQLRARIRGLFAAIGAEPKAARLVLFESFSAGAEVAVRAERVNRALERRIQGVFAASDPGIVIQPALAHGIVAAAFRVARAHCDDGGRELGRSAGRFSSWLLALRDPRLARLQAVPHLEPDPPPPMPPGTPVDQRLLFAAVAKLVARDGYGELTVPAIRRAAGVPRRCFDMHFEDVPDCFLAAVAACLGAAAERARERATGAPSWERAAVLAIDSVISELMRDPTLARLCLAEVLAPGRAGLELREQILARWAASLRGSAPKGVYGELSAEASIAAAWGVAEALARSGRLGRLRAAVPSMAFLVLAPAVGAEAAEAAIRAELGATPRYARES